MASSATDAACVCPANKDSALSTTANILSILTFACVLLLGTLYTFTSRLTSHSDIPEIRSQATQLRKQWHSRNAEFRALPTSAKQSNGHISYNLTRSLASSNENHRKLQSQLEALPSKADGSGERWYFVWRHLKDKRKRKELKDALSRTESSLITCGSLMCV
jgi:hypothetical protein